MTKLEEKIDNTRRQINEKFQVNMTHNEVAILRKIAMDMESYRVRQLKKIAHIVAAHRLSYRQQKGEQGISLLLCLPGETYEENPDGIVVQQAV